MNNSFPPPRLFPPCRTGPSKEITAMVSGDSISVSGPDCEPSPNDTTNLFPLLELMPLPGKENDSGSSPTFENWQTSSLQIACFCVVQFKATAIDGIRIKASEMRDIKRKSILGYICPSDLIGDEEISRLSRGSPEPERRTFFALETRRTHFRFREK